MNVALYRHPATVPANIKRLAKQIGADELARMVRTSPSALKTWMAGEVMPSVINQKKLAKLFITRFPEDAAALREIMTDDLKRAELTLDNALHERTGPRDESHKPARKNFLLVKIHLQELEQCVRAAAGKDPGPASVVDPEIADVYGAGDDGER